MTRIDSTKVKWRVQVRKSRAHKWVNKSGLYEVRSSARLWAWHWRQVFGFGNTRTVRHVAAAKGKA